MRASELKKDGIKTGAYLIDGNDKYWHNYAVNFFIGLVDENIRSFNLKILENAAVRDIIDSIDTMSCFPEAADVVIVKETNFKSKDDDAKKLLPSVKDTADKYLIFTDGSALNSEIKKNLTLIDADKSDVFEIKRIIRERYPDSVIQPSAVDRLTEYTGRDTGRILNELEKLTAYCNGAQIKASDVDLLVANTVENEIYEYTDAVASGNFKRSAEILERFQSRGVPQLYILSALTGLYRRMLHCSISPNKDDSELAKELSTKEYPIKKAKQLAKKYNTRRLKDCVDTLVNADFAFKSGVMSEDTAFKLATGKLMCI